MDIRTLLNPATSEYDAYEVLSSHGFTDAAKALANLRLLAEGVDGPALTDVLTALMGACSLSADPDACLNNFERVSAACDSRASFLGMMSLHPDGVKLLAPLFAASMFLTSYITGEPERTLGWLLAEGRLDAPKERDGMLSDCLAACPPDTPSDEAMEKLRHFKYTEFCRITVRDLLGRADLAETTREISNLADSALEAALRVAMRELDHRHGAPRLKTPGGRHTRCPFTVIALGKHGGRELNFSSDIDIMYVYLSDKGETSGPQKITNHQYFVKLGERLTKMIGEKTAAGFVFRVDLRLRPEGERGDLTQSLVGYETYYESWGQTWERSMLIKARPCAGDAVLGRAFMEMIRPFVFRKYLDYSSIAEIREMKKRIEKAGAARAGREVDLKKGVGGIREVEFFISALQLIYGGREPGIRERNSMKALHRLALKNLISFDEQKDLTRAYEFLRTAEHRVQVVDERQTHSLANEKASVEALARRMGFRERAGVSAGTAFMSALDKHTRRVREIYNGLFAERGEREALKEEGFDLLLAEDITEDYAVGLLEAEGFSQPHRAYRNVLLLRDGSAGSALTPRSRRLFMEIMPTLLSGCAASADPDMALNNLESFVSSYGSREGIHTFIKERPESATLLTKLLGSSEYFSRLFVAHPEMSDLLLMSDEGLDKAKAEMASELAGYLDNSQDFAGKMDALRKFKHAEETRIGVKDLLVNPGCRAVSKDLTELAEVVVGAALGMAADDMAAKHGLPDGAKGMCGIAVAGFGKLGAGELNYGSDLDILFIYDKPAKSRKGGMGGSEYYARLAERVIFALSSLTREGAAFRVDARLRPGGSKGVLAHTVGSLGKYYEDKASVWELQALTRARAVAGDQGLMVAFESMRTKVLSGPRDTAQVADAVRAMRTRMERELGRGKKGVYDIKYGRGGTVDVEFAVQYLQLTNGHAHPEVLTTDATLALKALAGAGVISGGDSDALTSSYIFLRELESKIRITTGQPGSVMPEDARKSGVLAARLGYLSKGEDAARMLVGDLTRHAEVVRGLFDRIVRASAAP